MTRDIHVVIGAQYGDEGKGKTVDWLCRTKSPRATVVRFNGGAQAGHTVVSGNKRHVFHHFGSGSLAGRPTFLSQYFVCNPSVFLKEREALVQLGGNTKVEINIHSPITTPYDVLMNHVKELMRGNARHGSCGMGFAETLEREQVDPSLAIHVEDLYFPVRVEHRLRAIRKHTQANLEYMKVPRSIIEQVGADAESIDPNRFMWVLAEFTALITARGRPLPYDDIVFEGAQGLLLDQHKGAFPYVTRSNTGMANVHRLLKAAGVSDSVNTWYCSRPYVTRHGEGPLSNTLTEDSLKKFSDATNVPNPWQGSLRLGSLYFQGLWQRIENDAEGHPYIKSNNLVFNCCDHLSPQSRFDWADKDGRMSTTFPHLVQLFANATDWGVWTSGKPEGDFVKAPEFGDWA